MISYWYYIGFAACVVLSAFFSGSEMSFASANRIRLKNAADAGSRRAKTALGICERFDDSLSAILIGNNLVNIAASSLSSVITILLVGEKYTSLATVIVTVIVIIFGETIPKIVAKKNATPMSIAFSYIIKALTAVLKPVIFVIVGFIHLLTKFIRDENEDPSDAAAEELQSIIETVENEGVIDEDRSELLRSALDFSEIMASEVMTARVDLDAIDIDDDYDELVRSIEEATHSRLPVYEDSIDNIIGVLYTNHFYKALIDNEKADVRSLLMEPCYVYKTVKLPAVLDELRRRKTHLAIVTDEYGGSMGVITMEDVLEQIVGDIWDESDVVETDIVEKGEGQYELLGDVSIGDFCELLDRDEDSFETESSTVGGWTLEMFGSFPKEGDSFLFENMTVKVLGIDGLRVEKVLVTVEKPEEEDD